MSRINSNTVLWAVFIALLLVLLPHTAWAFSNFEPDGNGLGSLSAWAAAVAFEAAIAVLVHKLAKHIEQAPRRRTFAGRMSARYLNAYAAGLVLALAVSTFANLSHAVEFGRPMRIFTEWGWSPGLYAVAFGAVLPFTSLLFARVLSNVSEAEQEANPELDKAREEIRVLRAQVRDAERSRATAEQAMRDAEQRFAAAGDLMARLFAEDKRQRILFVAEQWPGLPQRAIAVIAETSPSYVSEVLNNGQH
jgi:vacuolar-type H+-ATPase subunit H